MPRGEIVFVMASKPYLTAERLRSTWENVVYKVSIKIGWPDKLCPKVLLFLLKEAVVSCRTVYPLDSL